MAPAVCATAMGPDTTASNQIWRIYKKILCPTRFLTNLYALRSYTKKLGHVAAAQLF